jgi:hypothetical protein
MSNNSREHETVVVEQTTGTAAPIHEITEVPATTQSTPLGKLEVDGISFFLFNFK